MTTHLAFLKALWMANSTTSLSLQRRRYIVFMYHIQWYFFNITRVYFVDSYVGARARVANETGFGCKWK